jgi:KDO2-lipid IV(A) lauroyltransferase
MPHSTRIRYLLETLLVTLAYRITGAFSMPTASELGGKLLEKIGPYLRRTGIARNNIKQAMPELNDNQIEQIIKGMWNNLGRTLAEFPHIGKLDADTFNQLVEFDGFEHIVAANSLNKGCIYFTGHLANWEIAAKAFALHGYPFTVVIREANNPGLVKIIKKLRASYQAGSISKSQSGARQLIHALKNRERIGIFVDQKFNNGIKTQFFGREAMTAPSVASLALKYRYPVIPVRVIRQDKTKFKVSVYPPLQLTKSGNNNEDILDATNQINLILEGWIRDHPEQWFWIHNRWINSTEKKQAR